MGRKIQGLVIHHAGVGFGDVESFRRYHVEVKKWADIGYHRVILNGKRTKDSEYSKTLDGHISMGRPDDLAGAHVKPEAGIAPHYRNWNRRTLGICLVGDLRTEKPTRAQWAALVDACARLCKRHGLTERDIYGHREATRAGYTVCPGKNLDMKRLRAAVGLLLD